jgi:thiosulfate/3-mercaptopyruvate sulfurtransferase
MSASVFVEVDWLRDRFEDASIRIVDTRSTPHGAPGTAGPSAREQYAAGHIPGAIHLDYAEDLHDRATPYAARVAPPADFAEAMGAAGIGDEHTIVAYDDGTTPYAARMLWMCRYYGHDAVFILAGGLPAWRAAGEPVSQAIPHYPPARFTPHVRPALRATREEVLAASSGERPAQLLETQREQSYRTRDRDLPRAQRLSANDLLDDSAGGRIATPERLAELIARAGLDPHARTITSCGSGVSASGAYLALTAAGFTDVAVYDGSWMEWSHDGLPTVARG